MSRAETPPAPPGPSTTTETDGQLVARVRAGLVSERAHLNNAGTSLPSAAVVARIHRHLDLEAAIGGYEAMAAVADEIAALPASLARLFGPGVGADEIVPTESATRAWETVLWSIAESRSWSAADRVLVDQFSYGTMHTSLAALHATRGVRITLVDSLPDGRIDPAALAASLADAALPAARLVLVTHIPTHLGSVTDTGAVRDVLTAAAADDLIYALDVSQSLGQLPLDVAELGCHIAFAPGRKFLRAPRGTGVLYVRAALAAQLIPLAPPAGTAAPDGVLALPPAARRFDQFEHSLAVRLGLGVAAREADELGLDRIAALVGRRSREVIDLLGGVPGVRLTGTPDDRGIISFVHDAIEPAAVVAAATGAGVNIWVNPAVGAPLDLARRPVLPSVRVSPHCFTDDGDLERLARALHALPRA